MSDFDEIEEFIAQIPTLDRVIALGIDVPADNAIGKVMLSAVSFLSTETVLHYFAAPDGWDPGRPPMTVDGVLWSMSDDTGTEYEWRGHAGGGANGLSVMAVTFGPIASGARELRLDPPGRKSFVTIDLASGTAKADRERP